MDRLVQRITASDAYSSCFAPVRSIANAVSGFWINADPGRRLKISKTGAIDPFRKSRRLRSIRKRGCHMEASMRLSGGPLSKLPATSQAPVPSTMRQDSLR
jgi:hypothetical protein